MQIFFVNHYGLRNPKSAIPKLAQQPFFLYIVGMVKLLPLRLRQKFILYLLFVHLAFAAVAIFLLWKNRLWLLAVEAFFAISFILAIKLFRALFQPLDLVITGVQFIKDKDFTSRFNEVGQPEMDKLIAVYNKMIDHLREERTRLQEQHYFMDKILRASPSGIMTFDFDEKIAMINPSAEKMLQADAENLAGKKLIELQTPFAEALNRLKVGESQVIPLQGRRRVKCQKSQYLDRGFACNFILMEELTEELRRSEKAAYEKLIRMMSHEVNNSIGAVNSLLHSFLNYKNQLRDDDRKDYETALQVAIARTDHLNAFMRSFADVVRLPLPRRQPCDVQDLLQSISLLLGVESRKRGIVWKWDIEESLEPILMDKNQMEQVFVNIFKNAMEAIGENGTITIRLSKKGGRSFVIIEDTGSGLTPEIRANLFTPFFSTKENGQGLGLTMIQEILSQHRFEFFLDNPPGQPTQFVIYF